MADDRILEITFAALEKTRLYDLEEIPTFFGEAQAKQIIGLFTGNLRRSMQAILRRVQDYPTPVGYERGGEGDSWGGTWRPYYPGGDRLKGPHIRDNWEIDVHREAVGAGNDFVPVGALINWHPGARALMRPPGVTMQPHLLEPHYANDTRGGQVPKALRWRDASGKWFFSKGHGIPTPKKDTGLLTRLTDAVAEYGGKSFHEALAASFGEQFSESIE